MPVKYFGPSTIAVMMTATAIGPITVSSSMSSADCSGAVGHPGSVSNKIMRVA